MATADDFEEVHLPVDITVESYDTMLLLMQSNEPVVLMPTISALRAKIEDESVIKQMIDRVVELARTNTNEQLQIVISWFLGELAIYANKTQWAFDILSKSQAIPRIIKYAGKFDNPSMSTKCFEALTTLSEDSVTSKEIIEHGALPIFSEALKQDDPSIMVQVALAISRLSEDFQNRRAILESGLFDALVDFLAQEDDIDEEALPNALQALSKILQDSECARHFEESARWDSITRYLEDADKSIQTLTYAVMAQISSYQSFQQNLDDTLLQKFTEALQDLEEFDPVMPYLMVILLNCSGVKAVSKALAGEVSLLLDRIFSPQTEEKVKITMSQILEKLAANPTTRNVLLESEQLARLCKLLCADIPLSDGSSAPNPREIKKSMLCVLNSICGNQSIRSKLHEYGAMEQVLVILHDTITSEDQDNGWRVEFQMIILPMLYNMAGDAKLASMLIEKSISDLEVCLSSEFPDILNPALMIIATLVVDSKARDDIAQRPDLLRVLIKLIYHKKVAIRRNALHAVNTLGMQENISVQFCQFGIIEILQKFAASSEMINRNLSVFATTALDTLCQSNVIAKFWVKNVLDFDDKIEDGFYSLDPRWDKYRSLDDLLHDVTHVRVEALLLDKNQDEGLREVISKLQESFAVKPDPTEVVPQKGKKGKKTDPVEAPPQYVIPVWPHIAEAVGNFVVTEMGGPFTNGRIYYEKEVSACKWATKSDVVMLGQLKTGTTRHRALLFKYLAQIYGMDVLINRNPSDLSCTVRVRKGAEEYDVDLTGERPVLPELPPPKEEEVDVVQTNEE